MARAAKNECVQSHTDHVGVKSELKSKLRIPIGAHRLVANGLSRRPGLLLDDGEKYPLET